MKAIVLGKKRNRTLVEIIPDPACAGCKSCSRSQEGKVLLVHSVKDYREGTLVEIDMDDSSLLAAAFIAYGIPLIVFFISLYALYTLISVTTLEPFAEVLSFFGSIGILALTYFIIHRTDEKRSTEGLYEARIVKEIEAKEELCQLS